MAGYTREELSEINRKLGSVNNKLTHKCYQLTNVIKEFLVAIESGDHLALARASMSAVKVLEKQQ